jgi:hypothetical protein
MAAELFFSLPEPFAGFEQGFAGDTTDAQASSSQSRSFFDTGYLEAKLRGANGGNITARTSANDEEILLAWLVFQRRGGCMPKRAQRRWATAPLKNKLSTPQSGQGPVGVGKPQEGQQTDDQYLAEDWKAVDQEGADPASQGRFNQVQHVHKQYA